MTIVSHSFLRFRAIHVSHSLSLLRWSIDWDALYHVFRVVSIKLAEFVSERIRYHSYLDLLVVECSLVERLHFCWAVEMVR